MRACIKEQVLQNRESAIESWSIHLPDRPSVRRHEMSKNDDSDSCIDNDERFLFVAA